MVQKDEIVKIDEKDVFIETLQKENDSLVKSRNKLATEYRDNKQLLNNATSQAKYWEQEYRKLYDIYKEGENCYNKLSNSFNELKERANQRNSELKDKVNYLVDLNGRLEAELHEVKNSIVTASYKDYLMKPIEEIPTLNIKNIELPDSIEELTQIFNKEIDMIASLSRIMLDLDVTLYREYNSKNKHHELMKEENFNHFNGDTIITINKTSCKKVIKERFNIYNFLVTSTNFKARQFIVRSYDKYNEDYLHSKYHELELSAKTERQIERNQRNVKKTNLIDSIDD